MYLLEVLNPVAQQRGVLNARSINKRPSTLDGKTVGLLWSGTHGGDVALKLVGEAIKQQFKEIIVNFYHSGGYPSMPAVLKRTAEECDAVVGATAD